MIVVSDTTPLRYLAVLGQLDLLHRLFGTVHCPDVVIAECTHLRAPMMLRRWAANLPEWLHVATEIEIEASLIEDLDAGEAAAISLARRLGAQVILMDDRNGRRCALERGIATAGTLNILAQAGANGWVDYEAMVARLRAETNFWFRPQDVDAAKAATLPAKA